MLEGRLSAPAAGITIECGTVPGCPAAGCLSESASKLSCQNGRALALPRTRLIFGATLTAALALSGAIGASPASAWFLSPETSGTSGASSTHTLYWIAVILALVLIIGFNVALVSLIRRNRAVRGRTAEPPRESPRTQLRAGGALAGMFAVLLVLGVLLTERSTEVDAAATAEGSDPVHITATGQRWIWRYNYPDDVYSYYRLTIPVDTEIRLNALSTDVVHSWLVPGIGGAVDAVPGKSNRTSFVVEEEGVYEGRSAVFSGQGYPAMRTEVAVVSREEFESFLERRAEETAEAQERAAETYRERLDED